MGWWKWAPTKEREPPPPADSPKFKRDWVHSSDGDVLPDCVWIDRDRGVYNRHGYVLQKGKAVSKLAALIETITNPPKGNLICRRSELPFQRAKCPFAHKSAD